MFASFVVNPESKIKSLRLRLAGLRIR